MEFRHQVTKEKEWYKGEILSVTEDDPNATGAGGKGRTAGVKKRKQQPQMTDVTYSSKWSDGDTLVSVSFTHVCECAQWLFM